jgi:hypothetical protein
MWVPDKSRTLANVSYRLTALVLIGACVATACAEDVSGGARPAVASTPGATPSPAGVHVATSAQLQAALSQEGAVDIFMSSGSYESPRPFVNDRGHRLHGSSSGRTVFAAGLVIGGSAASRDAAVEGVVFDIRDSSKTLQGSAIHVWGGAAGARIVDVTIYGNGLIGSGIMVRQPEGLLVERVTAHGFSDYGILVDANDRLRKLIRPPELQDIAISNVARAQPRSSNGTAEACLWIGNTAIVLRAELRSCAWTGLWTGTAAHESFFDDVVIDDTPVGVYVEHFTTGSVFQRFRVGPHVQTGLACEWADPHWDGKPACVDDVVQDSTIDSCAVGISLGVGTTRTTIRRIQFRNQRVAAAVDPGGIDNRYADNDFGGVASGARIVTRGTVEPTSVSPICSQ